MSVVSLTPRASKLARKRHPWFFADDLAQVDAVDGDLVCVLDADGRELGLGFFAERSRLRLRLCGVRPEQLADAAAFFRARLQNAIERRASLRAPRAGLRLVHGEADGIPGLVIDQYADCLVLQATTSAVERHLDCIVPVLVERLEPRMVLARHDLAVRKLEGLPQEVRLLHGRRIEAVEIEEHGVRHEVAPFAGHKTGFYLDQRPARARVQALASGARVLDLFAYQGAFALAALAGGARSALAIDQSAASLERAQAAAQRNGWAGLETRRANAFDALRDMRDAGAQFDLVIVDPPAFAKSRREREGAGRGYRDLNRHALRLLAPDGWLLTCSCSHHVSQPMFEEVLRQAAAELPFRALLRERLMAGADHPVWIGLPESEYLKVVLLQRAD
jgi:23S rRNA (cytosine1962-C5)-methyltransferase